MSDYVEIEPGDWILCMADHLLCDSKETTAMRVSHLALVSHLDRHDATRDAFVTRIASVGTDTFIPCEPVEGQEPDIPRGSVIMAFATRDRPDMLISAMSMLQSLHCWELLELYVDCDRAEIAGEKTPDEATALLETEADKRIEAAKHVLASLLPEIDFSDVLAKDKA